MTSSRLARRYRAAIRAAQTLNLRLRDSATLTPAMRLILETNRHLEAQLIADASLVVRSVEDAASHRAGLRGRAP